MKEKKNLRLTKSFTLRERSERVIPLGTQTFSKSPTAFVQGASPVFLEYGAGSRVFDVDGNEYIDYLLGLGPVILGHNYPEVNEAVKRQLEKSGPILSLPHPLEIELAELLVEIIPCAEMVRFGKNGSDVTAGAVRLARAFTGREKIAFCGYHGWQDWYVAATTRDKGIPHCMKSLIIEFSYNDLDSLRSIFEANPDEIAGVIMEPVGSILPEQGFLENVREIAHKHGALLIFDEVITGFRLSLGGAQEYYDVIPDLGCFGKALGNGFPISVLAGRRDVMNLLSEVFFSFTFGGEILSITAALATINIMRKHSVHDHIWAKGTVLMEGLNKLSAKYEMQDYVKCIGLAPKSMVSFHETNDISPQALKSLFQQEVIRRCIMFNGNQFISFSHTDIDIQETLQAYEEALATLSDAVRDNNVESRLVGPIVQPVFRRP